MSQVELFQSNNEVDAVLSVLRIWPSRESVREYFETHATPEHIKERLRILWQEAWFIDIAVVCNPNPGKMGIGICARSVVHGNLRYAEYAGEGNAAVAVQVAAERAASIAKMRDMKLVVLRSNTKFLENKLGAPSEQDKQVMPVATSMFKDSHERMFVWTPDVGETGTKIAKDLAFASLN